MSNKRAEELLQKYIEGKCTAEELAALESWYNETSNTLEDLPGEPDYKSAYNRLSQNLPLERPVLKLWPRIRQSKVAVWIVAASIVLVLGGLAVILNLVQDPNADDNGVMLSLSKHNIAPGSNKAILTLANGKKIHLTDAKNGNLANENNIIISKTSDGQIIYNGKSINTALVYNTMSTPRGGQYTLTLSDGTKVILNAASSLKYPTSFVGSERKVELIGEAYFVVKHNEKQPFKVETKGQIVEDIGTEFNINAYTDENSIKTTLVEGAAKVVSRHPEHTEGPKGKVQDDVVLRPNQQSTLTNTGAIKVSQVDAESEVAWKNGDFVFNEEPLESIMRKVARWYNVEVNYGQDAQELKTLKFGGLVSRSKDIAAVLQIMENTGKIKFKIEERRITVMK